MKRLLSCFGLLLLLTGPSLGTVLSQGTIEQPVNLGSHADPTRIPLGPVVFESNHGYGRHPLISAPRACTHGPLKTGTGLELNMNLASAFGILVEPEDSTQVPLDPVNIRIKDWPLPTYSPYRKEQVLVAVLHCLLRSTAASPKVPLQIVIKAENEEDQKNLKAYTGNYISGQPLPGSHLTTDARGITYVVFPDEKPAPAEKLVRTPPALVPCYLETEEYYRFQLIPVWAGDDWKDSSPIATQPVTLYHDLFAPSRTLGPDINYLTRAKHFSSAKLSKSHLYLSTHRDPKKAPFDLLRSFCAFTYAAVLTTQPTTERPLTVQFRINKELRETFAALFESKDWVEQELRHGDLQLTTKLIWNAKEGKLATGFLPEGTPKREKGAWIVDFEQED